MLSQTLSALFTRDLNKLKTEIASYKSEEALWEAPEGIANSAGNLCLHLIGNLNGFIGAELGKSGFVRHRDLEFSTKDVPRQELLDKIEAAIIVVRNSLDMVTEDQLGAEYPIPVFKDTVTTEWFLVHLAGHLNYHLGQINYHRRLVDKQFNEEV